jgi:hypothetical protein
MRTAVSCSTSSTYPNAGLQPYLAAADVFVVSLFSGGGMRVKILDASL